MSHSDPHPYPIIDSHCHLDASEFETDLSEVLDRAREAGVSAVIIPGTDLPSSARAVSLCAPEASPQRYATVGVHPHAARSLVEDLETGLATLEELAQNKGVVAIGETGLDYYYDFSPPEAQRDSLRHHVRLAHRLKLPLVLHCRDAEADLLEILEVEEAQRVGGVVHCFTGTPPTAQRLLELGFHLGFTGIVTFKNAQALRDLVATLPLERVLLETDSPYLAPIPHRGKRNEPAFVPQVAATLGPVLGLEPAALARQTNTNARRLFGLSVP